MIVKLFRLLLFIFQLCNFPIILLVPLPQTVNLTIQSLNINFEFFVHLLMVLQPLFVFLDGVLQAVIRLLHLIYFHFQLLDSFDFVSGRLFLSGHL